MQLSEHLWAMQTPADSRPTESGVAFIYLFIFFFFSFLKKKLFILIGG